MIATKRDCRQVVPNNGPAREALRVKGQFWTPHWLARPMAAWVVAPRPPALFDPAVGPGTFFAAAREIGFHGSFSGFELDELALAESSKLGLNQQDVRGIITGDFLQHSIAEKYPAIISNPPYIRHHRLSGSQKQELRVLARKCLGFELDGRVGLHLYFLLKCLHLLSENGRLAFLLPADVCEGVSSTAFWKRITDHYRLEAVVSFAQSAAPFPGVDTNAMVFLISNRAPASSVRWVKIIKPDEDALLGLFEGTDGNGTSAAEIHHRDLKEALRTGLSRPPRGNRPAGVPLSAFARVVRGIATGANEFFFLTSDQAEALGLDKAYFRRAIGRTRDCPGGEVTKPDLEALDKSGRPTWLLNLGRQTEDDLPQPLRDYLKTGTKMGLPSRALIKTRTPWYRMEERSAPGLLFAYLGRRDCRFILNLAGVVPLTGFLCVYPWDPSTAFCKKLAKALNHPETLANLSFIGKSYGGGAVKVEPRQLDTLEIPQHVLDEIGLKSPPSLTQMALLDAPGHRTTRSGQKPRR